jgi:hypothetical protein
MSSIAERTMNVEALRSAIRAFAPQQAEGIEYLYVLLDDSMKKGYEAGAFDAKERSEAEAEVDRDNAWDDGYCQGVNDARVNPGKADNIVQEIIFDSAEFANDGKEFMGWSDEDVNAWDAYAASVRP